MSRLPKVATASSLLRTRRPRAAQDEAKGQHPEPDAGRLGDRSDDELSLEHISRRCSLEVSRRSSTNRTHVRGMIHAAHREIEREVETLHLEEKISFGRVVEESISRKEADTEYPSGVTNHSTRADKSDLIGLQKDCIVAPWILRKDRGEASCGLVTCRKLDAYSSDLTLKKHRRRGSEVNRLNPASPRRE